MRQKTKVKSWYEVHAPGTRNIMGGANKHDRREAFSIKRAYLGEADAESKPTIKVMLVTRYRLAPCIPVGPFQHRPAMSGSCIGQKWWVTAGSLMATIEEDRAPDDEPDGCASGGYDWSIDNDDGFTIDHGWNETLEHAKQNVERVLKDQGYKVKKEGSK